MNKNINLKMNNLTKIGLVTILLTLFVTFTGFFEIFSSYHYELFLNSFYIPIPLYLNSGILMMSIGLGLISTFVKKRRNIWFYTSIMVILIGLGITSLLIGYANPDSTGSGIQITGLGSFFVEYMNLVIYNILVASIAILSGPTIIIPYIVLSNDILMVISLFASFTAFYGYKGAILFLGMFHMYLEFYAIVLACLAGIRVALESFKAFIYVRKGFKNSFGRVKDVIVHEIVSKMPKIIILLIIAAFLEILWTPFWISYWLHHVL